MAGPISSLFVKLGLDAREFTQGIDASKKSVQGFSRDTSTALGGLGGKFNGFFGDVKKGFGLAFGFNTLSLLKSAGRAVGDFVHDSIEDASNLNETLSASKQIFGDNADDIEAWGKTAAEAFGQSERQAISTATTFAGLFKTVGVAADQSAEQARKMTELGSDLASFFNTDVKTAIDSLRSGLSGESEPLRKYNVFLSEAAVNAELLAMGEEKVGGQWTENQKVMGRYRIILRQTATAQGDFARTSDGLANSQRILAAEQENMSAVLGEKLLPLQLELTRAQIAAVDAVDGLASSYQDAKQALVETPKVDFLSSFPTRQQVEASLAGLKSIPAATEGLSSFQGTLFMFDVGGVKTAWQKQIDELNFYLAHTAFDETGQNLQAGLDESVKGLRLAAFLSDQAEAAAEAAVQALSAKWAQDTTHLADDAREMMRFAGQAMEAQAVADARNIGAGTLSALSQGLLDDRSVLEAALSDLRDILENGLTPKQLALEAAGKDYIKFFRQGMNSDVIGAKETAEHVAGVAIKAIMDTAVNGTPTTRGAKAIGQYLAGLFAGGMDSRQVDALLSGSGLSAEAIQGIHDQYPQFFTTGAGAAQKTISGWKNGKWYDAGFTASTNIRDGVKAYSWYTGGWNTAKAWIGGFADKFDAFNWANLINSTVGPYTSGQSPPKKGPLHFIDKWGFNVGKAWLEGFGGALARIGKVMPDLSGGGLAFATARVASLGVTAPGLTTAAAHQTVVNVTINGAYMGRAGLRELHADIEDAVRQGVRGASRQVGR